MNKRNGMCALLLLGKVTAHKRRLEEFGNWFAKLRKRPISENLDKMVEFFKNSFKPMGKEACDLIFKKLNNPRRESNRTLSKGGFYEPITKKRLF